MEGITKIKKIGSFAVAVVCLACAVLAAVDGFLTKDSLQIFIYSMVMCFAMIGLSVLRFKKEVASDVVFNILRVMFFVPATLQIFLFSSKSVYVLSIIALVFGFAFYYLSIINDAKMANGNEDSLNLMAKKSSISFIYCVAILGTITLIVNAIFFFSLLHGYILFALVGLVVACKVVKNESAALILNIIGIIIFNVGMIFSAMIMVSAFSEVIEIFAVTIIYIALAFSNVFYVNKIASILTTKKGVKAS